MKIAVIPARGGSKRILRKNIRNFAGKPIIAWAIEIAIKCLCFDQIIVTTDDEEIASIALYYGSKVPFIRPAELSNDYVSTVPVIAHAARWACEQGWDIDAICCIYATAPFVQVEDILTGLNELRSGSWDYVFSATDYSYPISRAFVKTPGGGTQMFFREHYETRSQDLPQVFHDAAQFYWGRPSAWLSHKRIYSLSSTTIHIPRWRVLDIDTEDDWRHAEMLAPAILSALNDKQD